MNVVTKPAIIIGCGWYEGGGRKDVVLVGSGDAAQIEELVRATPSEHRHELRAFFAPFVEGGEPAKPGVYSSADGYTFIMWWKRGQVMT